METLVQEEDAQPLSEPIIAPIEVKKFSIEEADLPTTYFSREFMMDLMNFPDQIRNIALVGHLHHGKTTFMDMLVLETHDLKGKTTGSKGSQVCLLPEMTCTNSDSIRSSDTPIRIRSSEAEEFR